MPPKLPDSLANTQAVYERLLKDRIVVLGTPIDDDIANTVIAQMLFLESESPVQPIFLYINSPGGSVTASLAIHDVMTSVRPRLHTVCVTRAQGSAVLLLASGTPGMRSSLPKAVIGLTPTLLGSGIGDADREYQRGRLNNELVHRLARVSGHPPGVIARDMQAEIEMTPEAAKGYGLIDAVAVATEKAGTG